MDIKGVLSQGLCRTGTQDVSTTRRFLGDFLSNARSLLGRCISQMTSPGIAMPYSYYKVCFLSGETLVRQIYVSIACKV